MWEKRILEYRDYFKEDEKFGTIESKRVGHQNNSSTVFGAEGSFRQLNID